MSPLPLFLIMLALSVTTIIYPWRFRTKIDRLTLHLPLLLLALWPVYLNISDIPGQWVRVDLVVLGPISLAAFACYLAKLMRLSDQESAEQGASDAPQAVDTAAPAVAQARVAVVLTPNEQRNAIIASVLGLASTIGSLALEINGWLMLLAMACVFVAGKFARLHPGAIAALMLAALLPLVDILTSLLVIILVVDRVTDARRASRTG